MKNIASWLLLLSALLLCSKETYAQQFTLEGLVSSESGKNLEGVYLFFKKQKIVAFSDAQGRFRMKVKAQKDTLYVSSLGYEPRKLVWDGSQQRLQIQLQEHVQELAMVNIRAEQVFSIGATGKEGKKFTKVAPGLGTQILSYVFSPDKAGKQIQTIAFKAKPCSADAKLQLLLYASEDALPTILLHRQGFVGVQRQDFFQILLEKPITLPEEGIWVGFVYEGSESEQADCRFWLTQHQPEHFPRTVVKIEASPHWHKLHIEDKAAYLILEVEVE